MRIADVVVDIPTLALDSAFSYEVTAAAEKNHRCNIGCAVTVPLGGRLALGYVVGMHGDIHEAGSAPCSIKEIIEVLTPPLFTALGAQCAQWMSDEYLAPLSSCIRLFLPPGGVGKVEKTPDGWDFFPSTVGEVEEKYVVQGPAYATYLPRENAYKQKSILSAIRYGEIKVSELTLEFGAVAASIKALEKAGAVLVLSRRKIRGSLDPNDEGFCASEVSKPLLTDEQQAAYQAIVEASQSGSSHCVVVDGVTGSGKTEVYLRAIEEVLCQGRRAIVLVPEISLTPQTVARFRGRFGSQVAVMHSRLSVGERFDQWHFVHSGEARVVVGARSALFSPIDNIGLIIIDEEHETSYKQDSAPRYVSRDVAFWLVSHAQPSATLVLGSATPSIETLYACHTNDNWRIVKLSHRVNHKPLPTIHVIDMAKEFSSGNRSMFGRQLQHVLETELSNNRKAVLLLNQRGFAKFLLCRDCGYVPECPNCATSFTYHEIPRSLKPASQETRFNAWLECHHCGVRHNAFVTCPVCGSPYIRKFGAGTQRVEEALHELLSTFDGIASSAQVIRMDADTTKRKGSHQKLLECFAQPGPAILLGTQMIAKGLDFSDVTLVGVVNADTTLKLPDFRAEERTFSLIEQVAGRAGRGSLEGTVYVQTYNPDAISIQSAAHYNRRAFLNDNLEKRRLLKYPPYFRLANVLVWGKNEQRVKDEAKNIYTLLNQQPNSLEILPASPCALSKLRRDYRYHIVIKADTHSDLPRIIKPLFAKRKVSRDVRVSVDIDPISLL